MYYMRISSFIINEYDSLGNRVSETITSDGVTTNIMYVNDYTQAPVEKDVYFRNLSELNPKGFVVTTYW